MRIEANREINPDPLSARRGSKDLTPLQEPDTVTIDGNGSPRLEIVSSHGSAAGARLARLAHHLGGSLGISMGATAPTAPVVSKEHQQLMEKLVKLQGCGFSFSVKTAPRFFFQKEARESIETSRIPEYLQSLKPGGRTSLQIRGENTDYLPITRREDLEKLQSFYEQCPRNEYSEESRLKEQLREWEKENFTFTVSGEEGRKRVGAAAAFAILTGGMQWCDGEVRLESSLGIVTTLRGPVRSTYCALEEIERTEKTLDEIKKLCPAATDEDLAFIGHAVDWISLRERGELVVDLLRRQYPADLSRARERYLLVTGTSGTGNEFRSNARIMLQLCGYRNPGKGDDKTGLYYRHILKNMKDSEDKISAFCGLLYYTDDLSLIGQALNRLEKPVRSESFGSRHSLLSTILYRQKDPGRSLESYGLIMGHMKKDESPEEFFSLVHNILEGGSYKKEPMKDELDALDFVRREYAKDPGRQKLFGRIYRHIGDKGQTLRAMELLAGAEYPQSPDIREEVVLRLLQDERNVDWAFDDLKFLVDHCGQWEDIRRVCDRFTHILSGCQRAWGAGAASRQENRSLAGSRTREICLFLDEERGIDTDQFMKFIEACQDKRFDVKPETLFKAAKMLRSPCKSEAYEAREKAFLTILEKVRRSESAPEALGAITRGLYEGEDLESGVKQFLTIAGACENDQTARESYLDMKKSFASRRDELTAWLTLADRMQSYADSKELFDLLQTRVRTEAYDKRFSIAADLISESAAPEAGQKPSGAPRKRHDALLDYQTLTGLLPAAEALEDGYKRFTMILSAINAPDRHEQTREAFAFVTRELPGLPGETPLSLTEKIVQNLLVTNSASEAMGQLLPRAGGGIDEDQEGFVIINGMKLPVNQQ